MHLFTFYDDQLRRYTWIIVFGLFSAFYNIRPMKKWNPF